MAEKKKEFSFQIAPKFKVLVLVGAGHANIQVLKKLTMKNYEGLQIITINNGYTSLYSGMTPGLIENYYVLDDASIDLAKLCKMLDQFS